MTTSRTTITRPEVDVSPREDRLATVKYSGQLRSAERSIRAKRYASAKTVLLRIIKDAPGTTVATQAQRLLDLIPSKSQDTSRRQLDPCALRRPPSGRVQRSRDLVDSTVEDV